MFSLLIVDDEPLAQVGLKSMLDWGALDVSIVGTSPTAFTPSSQSNDSIPTS